MYLTFGVGWSACVEVRGQKSLLSLHYVDSGAQTQVSPHLPTKPSHRPMLFYF